MRSYQPAKRDDVAEALEVARQKGTAPELFRFQLAGADLSGLDFTSPVWNGAFNTVLIGADFRHTKLEGCRLEAVDLACANLRGAKLAGANLRDANFYSALLEGADIRGATLDGANLVSAELHETQVGRASFSHARFGWTSHIGLDLTHAQGLAEIEHVYSSSFDSDTLRLTAKGKVQLSDPERSEIFRFLGSAGLDEEFLSIMHTWIGKPIEFFSAFISLRGIRVRSSKIACGVLHTTHGQTAED